MKITDLPAHRFPETKPLLTYLILFLLGVTLTLSGAFVFEQSSLLSRGAAGLGIGLLAAAVAGFLTDWIISPHSTEVLQKTISDAVGAPALLLPRRTLLTEMYQNMTKEATEIDIIGLTLDTFFKGFKIEEITQYIKSGRNFRIMLLFPDSYVAQIRQKEEMGTNFASIIGDSLRIIENICGIWKQGNKREWQGSFEVRFYDTLPHHAYFRADNQFIMGFYFRHTAGVHSEGILIRQKIFSEQDIAANLGEHFEVLWADNKDNTLCSIRAEQGFFKPEVRSNATKLKNELR
jgi:hypothetical protein